MYKIVVAGTGYVGLVTGVCLASKGYHVTCVDIDSEKVDTMRKGICPIYEPGLVELMNEYKDNLAYTTDYKSAYADADVIYIGVGTPERDDGSANLDYVYKVAEEIAHSITKDAIVVVKSTVPIGTNHALIEFFKEKLPDDITVEIASNPEFLSQGTAVKDTLHGARIVIGTETGRAESVLSEIYGVYGQPIVSTDIKSAEMIKYASNDFLALKISYINEIANLCEMTGADVEQVAAGMGYDPRIGNKFLKAGIGYGGSCFPKDTKALHWLAKCSDYEMRIVKAAIDVNEDQKRKLYEKSKQYLDTLSGKKVAVLGLTFKPDTDDLRDAPSLINVPLLLSAGAIVYAWDPVGMENFLKKEPGIIPCRNIDETLKDADICFIFTEWADVVNMDTGKFAALMKQAVILDGRNCFSPEKFKDEPVIYDSIGRKTVRNI